MADWPAKKNAQLRIAFPIYDADGDLVSAAAALDSELSSSGPSEGAFSTFADTTNEASEIATSSGMYELLLTAGEMNDDVIATITKTSTGGAKTAVNVIYTATRQLLDLAFPATSGRSFVVETDGMIHGDLKEWLGTAPNALNTGAVEADVQRWLDVVPLALVAQRVNASVGAMATDVLTADALAADAVDEIWDEPLAGHTTLATVGQVLNGLAARTGAVADAGPLAGDFDVDGFTEATDDHFNGEVMVFTSGALTGQARIISDYTGAGQNCVFDTPWIGAPADNDEFIILGLDVNSLADTLFRRDIDQSEAGASAAKHSLGTAILKAVSRVVDNAGSLETYRTDGTTLVLAQVLTVNASADPIDELGVGT